MALTKGITFLCWFELFHKTITLSDIAISNGYLLVVLDGAGVSCTVTLVATNIKEVALLTISPYQQFLEHKIVQ